MTSGTTEKKKTYSKAEILPMLYEYLKEAGRVQREAIDAFRAANDKVQARLKKEGISLSEFVDYSNLRDADPPPTKENP